MGTIARGHLVHPLFKAESDLQGLHHTPQDPVQCNFDWLSSEMEIDTLLAYFNISFWWLIYQ